MVTCDFNDNPARRAHATRRARAALDPAILELDRKLRNSMRGAIYFALRREAAKRAKGKPAAEVTVTLEELMAKLRATNYRCERAGLPFWSDSADRFGPTMPSLDRIEPDGPYSDANTRVVLIGYNSGRGRGSDADMLRMCEAVIAMHDARQKQAETTHPAPVGADLSRVNATLPCPNPLPPRA
jgi:hypothetical protein